MNEQIEKLLHHFRENSRVNGELLEIGIDAEKFAELIVQECAKVILETPVKYTEIDIMHIIRDNVKEHFGVEE